MKYYRDTYAEHPEDRENIEYGVRLRDDQSLVTLTGLYDQMRELGYDLRYARYVHCFPSHHSKRFFSLMF